MRDASTITIVTIIATITVIVIFISTITRTVTGTTSGTINNPATARWDLVDRSEPVLRRVVLGSGLGMRA